MFKLLALIGLIVCGTSFAALDETYYLKHPKELQSELISCKSKNISSKDCAIFNELAIKFNELAYELSVDPQGYGQKILMLQMMLAKAPTLSLQDLPTIEKNKQQLATRLIIISVLESPES